MKSIQQGIYGSFTTSSYLVLDLVVSWLLFSDLSLFHSVLLIKKIDKMSSIVKRQSSKHIIMFPQNLIDIIPLVYNWSPSELIKELLIKILPEQHCVLIQKEVQMYIINFLKGLKSCSNEVKLCEKKVCYKWFMPYL